MEKIKNKCCICNFEFDFLELHIRIHHLTKKEYFNKYLKKEKDGICLFCKIKPTKFKTLQTGYSDFCSVKCAKQHQSNNTQKLTDMLAKRKSTTIKKYGVDHHMQCKVGIDNYKKSIKEKYGVDSFSKTDEFKEKYKSTCLEKYNEIHPLKSNFVVENMKNTNLKKYGVDNVSKLPEIVKKIKLSKLKNYNDENYNNREKYKSTCLKKYNVDHHSKEKDYIDNFKKRRMDKFLTYLFDGNRLKNILKPLFKKEEFKNVNNKYQFQCIKCGNIFCDKIDDGRIPRCSNCYPYSGNISFMETEFLNFLNIENRQCIVENYKVDGISNEIIHEFLGDYWHGNPEVFDLNDINQSNKKTFGELYQNTIIKFMKLSKLGYTIKYIWENDWIIWKKSNKLHDIPIEVYSSKEIL